MRRSRLFRRSRPSSRSRLSSGARLVVAALALLVIALVVPSLSQARVTVQTFDDRHSPNHTRLVFETNNLPLYYYDHKSQGPNPTLRLRLGSTKLATRIPNRMRSSRFIEEFSRKAVKQGNGDEDVEFIFDLVPETAVKISILPPAGEHQHRLLVDLSKTESDTGIRSKNSDSYTKVNDYVVVAVDAGHGGDDPGAMAHDLHEKDITLAIANYIVDELAKSAGIKGLLIRSQDVSVSLRQRIHIARALRADLFVSIHADAYINPEASGMSVYTYADRSGASSDAVASLASHANSGIVDLPPAGQVTDVLASLAAQANRAASVDYGSSVLAALGRSTRLHSDHIEQGDFTVLTATDIPSILIETGFITNPREAELLGSIRHQRKIAKNIAHALVAYIDQQSRDTNWMQPHTTNTDIYTVAIGDTLNKIAEAFDLAPSSLARYNDIRNKDDLKAGDILFIP